MFLVTDKFPKLGIAYTGVGQNYSWLTPYYAGQVAIADYVELNMDAPNLPEGVDFMNIVRQVNPQVVLSGYAPAFYMWDTPWSSVFHFRETARKAIVKGDLWLKESNGDRVVGLRPDEFMIDMRKPETQKVMKTLYESIIDHFDVVRLDVASPTTHYIGRTWYVDGIFDGNYAKFDDEMASGLVLVCSGLPGGQVWINQGHMPSYKSPDTYSPYAQFGYGTMSESHPDDLWYPPTAGAPTIPRGTFLSRWLWHMDRLRDWTGPKIIIPGSLSLKKLGIGEYHDHLFTMATSCLLDRGIFMPLMKQTPIIPKAMWVDSAGNADKREMANRHWLGRPTTAAYIANDDVYARKFEHGMVAVNPGAKITTIDVPENSVFVEGVNVGVSQGNVTLSPYGVIFLYYFEAVEPAPEPPPYNDMVLARIVALEKQVASLGELLEGALGAIATLEESSDEFNGVFADIAAATKPWA